ncbi:MAG: hypothetical protein A2X22_14480 [Bacteroidetes bacterium GWF2_49_14]|nr:MAG: hypothetical protein A2X22_14480 [Bacteroidetes bacterium GWF2_49_14]
MVEAGAQGIQVSFSQPPALSAFAGKDTLMCSGHSVTLGGEPTASGGYTSYAYLWSPPDGLNDPTSANPVATPGNSKTYMVSVTDGRGCVAVSFVNVHIDPCLGIDENSLYNNIRVFPNPSQGSFTISGLSALNSTPTRVQILNRLGQVVYTQDYTGGPAGDLKIETQMLESGMYFLRIRLTDHTISQRLVIR